MATFITWYAEIPEMGMEGGSTDLSVALQTKVRKAQLAYQRAIEEYRRLMGISADTCRPNDPTVVDGNLAARQAIQVHRKARDEYERALREFTDFILTGKTQDSRQR